MLSQSFSAELTWVVVVHFREGYRIVLRLTHCNQVYSSKDGKV